MEDLFNAWILWYEQDLSKEYIIYGYNIISWGRIGKILELVSVLTILVEIIGVNRINSFSTKVRSYPDTFKEYIEKYDHEGDDDIFDHFFTISLIVLYFYVVYYNYTAMEEDLLVAGYIEYSIRIILLLIIAVIPAMIAYLLFGFAILVIISLIAIAITMTIRPVLFVLKSNKLLTVARIATLVIFLTGFHFTLLAS